MLGVANAGHLPPVLPTFNPTYTRRHRHQKKQKPFEEQHSFRANRVGFNSFLSQPVASPPRGVVDAKEISGDDSPFPLRWVHAPVRIVPKLREPINSTPECDVPLRQLVQDVSINLTPCGSLFSEQTWRITCAAPPSISNACQHKMQVPAGSAAFRGGDVL